jgi:hypothetical protein
MAVKVTLEFASVDAAIVALGKLVGTKVTAVEPQEKKLGPPTSVEEHVARVEARKAERKQRADKGQPRAPYKPRNQEAAAGQASPAGATGGVTDAGKAGEQPAAPTSTVPPVATAPTQTAAPAQTVTPAQSAAPAAAATAEEVQTVVAGVFERHGYDVASQLLQRFGVSRGRDLKPEQYADFVAMGRKVLAATAGDQTALGA